MLAQRDQLGARQACDRRHPPLEMVSRIFNPRGRAATIICRASCPCRTYFPATLIPAKISLLSARMYRVVRLYLFLPPLFLFFPRTGGGEGGGRRILPNSVSRFRIFFSLPFPSLPPAAAASSFFPGNSAFPASWNLIRAVPCLRYRFGPAVPAEKQGRMHDSGDGGTERGGAGRGGEREGAHLVRRPP